MADVSNWDKAFNYGMQGLGQIGAGISGIGSSINSFANAQTAASNRKASWANYEAQIREVQTNKALNLASNRMDYILSGFQVGSGGSTDLVQDLTAKTYDADINILRINQRAADEAYRKQEKGFKIGGIVSAVGAGLSVFTGGASMAAAGLIATQIQ